MIAGRTESSASDAAARLEALVGTMRPAVLIVASDGRVAFTNQSFCRAFRVPHTPEELTGMQCAVAAQAAAGTMRDPAGFLARVSQTMTAGVPVYDERLELADGRILTRDFFSIHLPSGQREVVWYYRDITAQEQLRTQAEELAQSRAALLNTVSHDVRTPLAGLIGLIDIMLNEHLDERLREVVLGLRAGASNVVTMLNDLLDVARAEAGRLVLAPAPVSLEEILETAAEMVAPQALAKGVLLTTGVAPEVPVEVLVDPGRLRQIVMNLAANAVKFTDSGVVTLEARVIGEELTISVRDTGIGLDPERIEELFEEFEQVHSGVHARHGGAGLGLAISSRLAKLMGGTLTADNEVHGGAVFTLTLPLIAASQGALPRPLARIPVALTGEPKAVRTQALAVSRLGAHVVSLSEEPALELRLTTDIAAAGETAGEGLPLVVVAPTPLLANRPARGRLVPSPLRSDQLVELIAPALASPTRTLDAPPAPMPIGRTALLAEDDPTNRRLLTRMLELLGVSVVAMGDGQAALEQAVTNVFDVILMDIHMPKVSGLEVARLIREQGAALAEVPIVSISADSGWVEPASRAEAWITTSLPKPVTLAGLADCLRPLLTRSPPAAPPGAPPAPRARGEQRLRALLADVGEEALSEAAASFRYDMVACTEELRLAAERGDGAKIVECAHALRSGADMFGAREVADRCRDLQALTVGGRVELADVLPMIAELSRACADCSQWLELTLAHQVSAA
ncbi:MAG: ATP-binding protein [Candidatus Nanopelagicales bacterium]